MTKPKLPPASDWRARDIAVWNCSTFTQFIVDRTQELYGVTYAPGGGGSVSQRWLREKGMLKRAQDRCGNAVLKRFIELCWRNYKTNKPKEYPYPTYLFMASYMDRFFINAELELNREARIKQVEAKQDYSDIIDWL